VTYKIPMFSFVETQLFSQLAPRYLSDEEIAQLQAELAGNPEVGVVIPGTGGVRKMRWGLRGRGKRGGGRIIYYVKPADGVIWLLTIYAKSQIENIKAEVLRRIKEEIDG